MVKKKEKKREVPPLTKQRRGIPWEYLSRMRSAVGTTGSCTGESYWVTFSSRPQGADGDLGDTGRKGWKDERRTGTRIGVEHTIVFRHTFSPSPLEDNARLASNHLYRAPLNGHRFSFSPRWHVTALIK